MRKNRPTVILVIAILHLTFGGLGLLCSVCSGAATLVGAPKAAAKAGDPELNRRSQARQELTERLEAERIPFHKAYTRANVVVNWLLPVVHLAAGIGLLQMYGWGRWTSIGYAVLAILHESVVAFYTLVWFRPVYQEVFRQAPVSPEEGGAAVESLASAGGSIMPFVLMIFPVVVLVVMFLPSVTAAFRDGGKDSWPVKD